ncbi:MAG TPA: hypothetical protein VI757_16415 [Bacteroidia bacterium]|nr:hypothetical protein [Bacteroidia bacterium]
MKIKISWLLQIGALMLLFSPAFFSCKKDEPTKAVITVLDSNEAPLAGITVSVFQDSVINTFTGVQANIRDTKVSDGSGKTEHTFKWEAFLNVEASRILLDSLSLPLDTDTAKGSVRLEYQKTVEATVQFHP